MRAPTLVPGTAHLVLNDFGALGCAYLGTDEAKADEWTIVEKIISVSQRGTLSSASSASLCSQQSDQSFYKNSTEPQIGFVDLPDSRRSFPRRALHGGGHKGLPLIDAQWRPPLIFTKLQLR